MSDDTAIEMFVGGLVLDPNTQAPVVVLKDESGEIALPIWIGIAEATSIASAIKQVPMARPLTHDLINDLFGELGVRVQRIMITELRDSTYYAELVLSYGDKALIMDSRPSDAIGIALRASAPIYVSQAVLDQAKVTFGSAVNEAKEAVDHESSDADEQSDGKGVSDNFNNIDKNRWREILNDLDPEDFKYKM